MAARGASARADRLAPQTTREPMRRMSLWVVVLSPPRTILGAADRWEGPFSRIRNRLVDELQA